LNGNGINFIMEQVNHEEKRCSNRGRARRIIDRQAMGMAGARGVKSHERRGNAGSDNFGQWPYDGSGDRARLEGDIGERRDGYGNTGWGRRDMTKLDIEASVEEDSALLRGIIAEGIKALGDQADKHLSGYLIAHALLRVEDAINGVNIEIERFGKLVEMAIEAQSEAGK
jgi:hypothetical protein